MAGSDNVKTDIVRFAMRKINGAPLRSVSREGRLSALAIRILLDFEPQRKQGRQIAADLVANHMRIAYSIPEHCEYMRTGAPSELILAEAAARLLDDDPSAAENVGISSARHANICSKKRRKQPLTRVSEANSLCGTSHAGTRCCAENHVASRHWDSHIESLFPYSISSALFFTSSTGV